MLILPAIDILNGNVVRLTKGDYEQSTEYNLTPIEIAKRYENFGFKMIHIVDLLAAKSGSITTFDILNEIKKTTVLGIQFGGGIRNSLNVKDLFETGVDKIIIGSLSIQNKNEFEKILSENNPDKFIIAIDSENENILTKGWTEKSGVPIYDHIEYCKKLNANNFLCTDIGKDGTLNGPNVSLYEKIMKSFPDINLIASGGISSIHDLVLLKNLNLYAVVVGKAIYENKIKLEDLAKIGD